MISKGSSLLPTHRYLEALEVPCSVLPGLHLLAHRSPALCPTPQTPLDVSDTTGYLCLGSQIPKPQVFDIQVQTVDT